jgi:predicted Fe-Mo cluster-binding NifX family protein
LQERSVECIISCGIGRRAKGFFNELGIQTIVGVSGRIDEVIEKLQKGTWEGGESLCKPGQGKGYGLDKTECDHKDKRKH